MTEDVDMQDDVATKSRYLDMTEQATEMLANVNLPATEGTVGAQIREMVNQASGMLQNTARGISSDGENSNGVQASIVAYDARFMAQATCVVKCCAQAVDLNATSFNPTVFAENIVNYMEESPMFQLRKLWDWDKIHREALKCAVPVPSYDFMFGTFDDTDIPPKKRRVYEKSNKVACATKRPEIVNANEKSEDAIEESVQIILKQLSRAYKAASKQPVCYFTFTVDPDSFGNTIENIFHLSFLIKDGFIKLSMDKHGLPVLTPLVHGKSKDGRQEPTPDVGDNEQMIVSINIEEWEEVIKCFKIKTAMIKLPRNVPTSSQAEPPMTNGNSRKRDHNPQPSTSRA